MNRFIKYFSLAVLIISVKTSFSQSVHIQPGVVFSKLTWEFNGKKLKDDAAANLYISAGVDYLNTKFFNLSTNAGYFTRGGKHDVVSINAGGSQTFLYQMTSKLNYITLNTEGVFKLRGKNLIPFVSAGPRVDFLVSQSDDIEKLKDDSFESVVYGFNVGIGAKYIFMKKFSAGLACSYLGSFNKISKDYEVTDQSIMISAKVGIRF